MFSMRVKPSSKNDSNREALAKQKRLNRALLKTFYFVPLFILLVWIFIRVFPITAFANHLSRSAMTVISILAALAVTLVLAKRWLRRYERLRREATGIDKNPR